MALGPVFKITYWGITGTLAAPLRPAEVEAKIRTALRQLAMLGRLQDLAGVADNSDQFQLLLQDVLPFHLRSTYGGNTTCVEVQTPDALFILDCGTGFRELGMELERRWNASSYTGPRLAHVFITHAHMDHTFATPFFDPYLDPRNDFTVYGSAALLKSLDAVLNPSSPLSSTYFPATINLLKALRKRVAIEAGQTLTIGSTTVSTIALRHPGGCLGFRFDCNGKSFVFCTDHEHAESPDRALADFARGADLLYLDGQYLAGEYEGRVGVMHEPPMSRRGWGHSAVEACAATAVAAGARQLHVGHREPKRDDADIARVETQLRQCLGELLRQQGKDPAACTACVPIEGMTIQW